MNKTTIINFAKEIAPYFFNSNEKYRKWGADNKTPLDYIQLYEGVVEHSAAINFIANLLVKDGVEQLNYWDVQKLALDYLILGGFSVEVLKTRGGGYTLNYIDISKLRLNPDKTKLGYSDKWVTDAYKADVKWVDITPSVNKEGIFWFKNPKSRGDYPTPYWYASLINLKTMQNILEYHYNNSENGFTPSVIINLIGEPDDNTKAKIQKQFEEKFTGTKGKKFMLNFAETKESAATIEKIEADNLDEKFSTLQQFIQNQIIVSHQITSPQLIGIKADNQGFSKTEYSESIEIFKENTISSLRKELEYGFSLLFNKEIQMKEE